MDELTIVILSLSGVIFCFLILIQIIKVTCELIILLTRGVLWFLKMVLKVLFYILISPLSFLVSPFLFVEKRLSKEKNKYHVLEKISHNMVSIYYAVTSVINKNERAERIGKIKNGDNIYCICHHFYLENNCYNINYDVTRNGENLGFVDFKFAENRNQEEGCILLTLYDEDYTPIRVGMFRRLLKYINVASENFMKEYPTIAAILLASNSDTKTLPYLTSINDYATICIPLIPLNIKTSWRKNDFANEEYLILALYSLEIENSLKEEISLLIRNSPKKNNKYQVGYSLKSNNWLNKVGKISLKVGCKLLIFAAGAYIGTNFDIPDFDMDLVSDASDSDFGEQDISYEISDLPYVEEFAIEDLDICENNNDFGNSNVSFMGDREDSITRDMKHNQNLLDMWVHQQEKNSKVGVSDTYASHTSSQISKYAKKIEELSKKLAQLQNS